MANNKLEQKIIKLLELSKKNSNKEEAIAAAAKAQELMAKYNISVANLKGNANKQPEFSYASCVGRSYRFKLAQIIADNYGVKLMWSGKMVAVFYGYPANVTTATKVYEWLWNVIHRMADSYQTKVWKQGNGVKGVYSSFVQGFLTGLKETLDANCKALKITVDENVVQLFDEYCKQHTKTFTSKGMNISQLNVEAFNSGANEGKKIMTTKQIGE